MGNKDGLLQSILAYGTNSVIHINKNSYFSFAYEDEIALVINQEDPKFYILNCSILLWKQVKKKVKECKNLKEIKKWWIKQSKKYEISDWSEDFNKLK